MFRLASALCLAAALALGATASADAAKLKLGVYDCTEFDFYENTLNYKGSVKLLKGNRYQHAYNRRHARLERPTKGTYSVRGSRIRFRGGAMRKTPGLIRPRDASHKEPWFDVLVNGERSGISCYRQTNP